jgi:hypothetical protein
VHDKQNTFGDAWKPILQQPTTPADRVAEVPSWMQPPAESATAQEAVEATITEVEVRAAIMACKAVNATGPDRLGNDWYRAYADDLTPILTTLLDRWYEDGVFPTSFLDADIFCLKSACSLHFLRLS